MCIWQRWSICAGRKWHSEMTNLKNQFLSRFANCLYLYPPFKQERGCRYTARKKCLSSSSLSSFSPPPPSSVRPMDRLLHITPHTYLAALSTNPPECSRRVWSRTGREGCSGMLHYGITQMVYYITRLHHYHISLLLLHHKTVYVLGILRHTPIPFLR